MTRRIGLLILVVALAFVTTACGGASGGGDHAAHGGEESMAEPVADAETIELSAVDIDYKPDTMTIPAGEPVNVAVTNDGEALHDFTLEEADIHFDVKSGETKTTSLTLDEPGQYKAYCSVAGHAEAGMEIAVTVE